MAAALELHGCGVGMRLLAEPVGRLVDLVGRLMILAREWTPSEVDQWELVEREPHSEVWLPLGLEPPPSEVRGSPVEVSGLEPPTSEVWVGPVELSMLERIAGRATALRFARQASCLVKQSYGKSLGEYLGKLFPASSCPVTKLWVSRYDSYCWEKCSASN
jgi:hypothetical protein